MAISDPFGTDGTIVPYNKSENFGLINTKFIKKLIAIIAIKTPNIFSNIFIPFCLTNNNTKVFNTVNNTPIQIFKLNIILSAIAEPKTS